MAPKKSICCLYWFYSVADFVFVSQKMYLFTQTRNTHFDDMCVLCTYSTSISALPIVHLRDVHSKMIIIKSTNRTVVFHFFLFAFVCLLRHQTSIHFILFLSFFADIRCSFSLVHFFRISIYFNFRCGANNLLRFYIFELDLLLSLNRFIKWRIKPTIERSQRETNWILSKVQPKNRMT